MASLMEELMVTLESEIVEYEALLELSRKKTPIIVKGDMDALRKITDDEQKVVDLITGLENKRSEIMKDIANVINKDVETLKLTALIEMLKTQPKEQKRLSEIHDKLKVVVTEVRRINTQNQSLIDTSLEMIEFEVNMYRSLRQAPQTANYGAMANSTGNILGSGRSGFDAKQ